MITRLDGHLLLPPDDVNDLIEILDLVAEVLRHGGPDLQEDITDRYQPGTYEHLIATLDDHTETLYRAVKTPRHEATR
jgi:hypothetical protein